MTEFPVGAYKPEEPQEDSPPSRGRSSSWERRLSEARERREKIIADREDVPAPGSGSGGAPGEGSSAIRDLAAALRGEVSDDTVERDAAAQRKMQGFSEPSQEPYEGPDKVGTIETVTKAALSTARPAGPGGITPNRLAEARRAREQVLALREEDGAETVTQERPPLPPEPEAPKQETPEPIWFQRSNTGVTRTVSVPRGDAVTQSDPQSHNVTATLADPAPIEGTPADIPPETVPAGTASKAATLVPLLAPEPIVAQKPRISSKPEAPKSRALAWILIAVLVGAAGFGLYQSRGDALAPLQQEQLPEGGVSTSAVSTGIGDVSVTRAELSHTDLALTAAPGLGALIPFEIVELPGAFSVPTPARAMPVLASVLLQAPLVAPSGSTPPAPIGDAVAGATVSALEASDSDRTITAATFVSASLAATSKGQQTDASAALPSVAPSIAVEAPVLETLAAAHSPETAFDALFSVRNGVPLASEPVEVVVERPNVLRLGAPELKSQDNGGGMVLPASLSVAGTTVLPKAVAPGIGRNLVLVTSDISENAKAAFANLGFRTVEVRDSHVPFPNPQVHFFHDSDAGSAAQIAELLGGEAVDLAGLGETPPAGTLVAYLAK